MSKFAGILRASWPVLLACTLAGVNVGVFAAWQQRFVPLRSVAHACLHDDAAAIGANVSCHGVWFDIGSLLSPSVENPAGALAARNWVHTLWLAAAIWFVGVCVPRQPRALAIRWLVLVCALLIQPLLLTRTLDQPRPEPPFGSVDDADGLPLRALFPASFGDLDDLLLPLDAPLLTALFLCSVIGSVHGSIFTTLLGTTGMLLAAIYAVVLRRVPAPSFVLTALFAWALTHDLAVYDPPSDSTSAHKAASEDEDSTSPDDDAAPGAGAAFEVGGTMSDDDNDDDKNTGNDDHNGQTNEFSAEDEIELQGLNRLAPPYTH